MYPIKPLKFMLNIGLYSYEIYSDIGFMSSTVDTQT